MPAGIEIIRNGGGVLLDSNIEVISVSQKGREPYNPIPAGGLNQMVATGPVAADGSFDWWTFAPGNSSANFGLQAFDASGKLTFCAARQTARVVDQFGLGNIGSADVVRSYPAGRVYAAYASITSFTEVQLRGSGMFSEYRIFTWRSFARMSGSTVTAGWDNLLIADWTPVPPGGQPSFPAPAYQPQVFILDATGY